jgi:hypothetical protein
MAETAEVTMTAERQDSRRRPPHGGPDLLWHRFAGPRHGAHRGGTPQSPGGGGADLLLWLRPVPGVRHGVGDLPRLVDRRRDLLDLLWLLAQPGRPPHGASSWLVRDPGGQRDQRRGVVLYRLGLPVHHPRRSLGPLVADDLPLAIFLVFVALAFAAAGAFTGSAWLFTAAGATALTFAFLAFCSFVSQGVAAMGGKPVPRSSPDRHCHLPGAGRQTSLAPSLTSG